MINRKTRITGSLLLVLLSLVAASLACYSGQIPGVFELTPYSTLTPLPVAENARFDIMEVVLAPNESGRAFFNMTEKPEPLDVSLLNSKAMCEGDSPAQVLYAGHDPSGNVYYLVDCVGSVGWASETRLAGPLNFSQDDLAITRTSAGLLAVNILDDSLNPMPFNPLQTCNPETIVTVRVVQAFDPDGDGFKDVYYQIACPTTGGDLIGWVTNDELVGPVEINIGERALALASEDGGDIYALASEPAPVTETNKIEDESCKPDSILQAESVKLVDQQVYYQVSCGEVQGWTAQERFVGPLLYDVDDPVLIFVSPRPVFADELPADVVASLAPADTAEGTDEDSETEAEGEAASDSELRAVVEYTPPLYLTDSPGLAVPEGDGANVVGQCVSGSVARIGAYEGLDTVYYKIECEECVATETDADGVTSCTAYEARQGWVEQQYLLGPLAFIPGEQAAFTSRSRAIDAEAPEWARIPATQTGAAILGRFTEYSGRCLVADGVQVLGVVLEKARTSNAIDFFYKIQCTGQKATYGEAVDSNSGRPVEYSEELETITGYVSASDLEEMAE